MLRVLMLCVGLLGTILFVGHSQTVDAGWSRLAPASSRLEVLNVKKDNNDDDHHKKKNCTKLVVCDYFAPAAWCSSAPCCKKWHYENYCQ